MDAILSGCPCEIDDNLVVEALEQSQFDIEKAKELLREKLGHLMLPSPPDSQADTPREVYPSSEADVCMDIDINAEAETTMCSGMVNRYTPESTVQPEEPKPIQEHPHVPEERYQRSSPSRKRSRSPVATVLLDGYDDEIKRPKLSKESSSCAFQGTEFPASIIESDHDLHNPVGVCQSDFFATEIAVSLKEPPPPPPVRSGIRIQDLIHPTDIEPERRLPFVFPATVDRSAHSSALPISEPVAEPVLDIELPSKEAKSTPSALPKKRQPRKKTAAAPPPQPTRRSRRLQAKVGSDQPAPSRPSTPPPQVEATSPPESPLSSVPPSPDSTTSVESIGSTIYVNTPVPHSRQKTAEPAPAVQDKPEQKSEPVPPRQQPRKVVQPKKQTAKPKPHTLKAGTGTSGVRKRRSTTYGMKQNNFRVIYV